MTQAIEHQPSKHNVLSSNPITKFNNNYNNKRDY
jgi:hypothetical protein